MLRHTLLASLLLFTLSGCDFAGLFVGDYYGEGTIDFTFTYPDGTADRFSEEISTPQRVTTGGDADLEFEFLDRCHVPLSVEDLDTARVEAGETCVLSSGNVTWKFTFRSGSLTRGDQNLSARLRGDVILTVDGYSWDGTFEAEEVMRPEN